MSLACCVLASCMLVTTWQSGKESNVLQGREGDILFICEGIVGITGMRVLQNEWQLRREQNQKTVDRPLSVYPPTQKLRQIDL